MTEPFFSITKTPVVTGETFSMDSVHLKAYGEVPDLVRMFLTVMKSHPEVIAICSTALHMHYRQVGAFDEWLRLLKITDALWDEPESMFPG